MLLNILTLGLWGKIGKITHYALDALLISTILAGMRRTTGLTLKKDSLSEDKNIKNWIDRYLGVGEWMMDKSVAIAGSSGWFERKH